MSHKGRLTLIIYTLFTIFSGTVYGSEPPIIMVSIKPFYNLCAKVMQSVGKPHLLLQHNASPHDYHLKPSDLKMITSSDLVIWGGPELEGFLQKPIANAPTSKNLNLASIKGLKLLPLRTSTNWDAHEHCQDHDHSHEYGVHDSHFWLDTNNAITIVKAIAKRLGELSPEHAEIYNKNTNEFIKELQAKKSVWTKQLIPMKHRKFIVFHDAYQYFDQEFALDGVGAISLHPEIPPSVQRIQQIHSLLQNHPVSCIFSEPQFNNKIISTLIADLKIYHGVLDPLGQDHDLGPDGYFILLDKLVSSFVACS